MRFGQLRPGRLGITRVVECDDTEWAVNRRETEPPVGAGQHVRVKIALIGLAPADVNSGNRRDDYLNPRPNVRRDRGLLL